MDFKVANTGDGATPATDFFLVGRMGVSASAVVALFLSTFVLRAQSPTVSEPECGGVGGDSSAQQWTTDRVGQVFAGTDSESVDYRQSHSMTTADSGSTRLLANARTCHTVSVKVKEQLKHLFVPAVPLSAFEPYYFRAGDYYAVLLMPARSEKRQFNSYAPLLIFRARDLYYVGLVLL